MKGSAMSIHDDCLSLARAARAASRQMALADSARKNDALRRMADLLRADRASLKAENQKDLDAGRAAGLSAPMLDRLALADKGLDRLAEGLVQVAGLPDPVGAKLGENVRPNGLVVQKWRTPIGVVCVIFESRPNVTVEAGSLCLKSGNAVILRGGKEAIRSNLALGGLMGRALAAAGLPAAAAQVVPFTDHEAVTELVRMNEFVDMVIPRGGRGLIEAVVDAATVPVLKHYLGICAVYVDKSADMAMAEKIALNSKVQRPAVCNAMETLLVHQDVAARFLSAVGPKYRKAGVEIRGCERTRKILDWAKPATEQDWRTEFLDLILAVRVVGSLDEAIRHIDTFGSHHTDAIVAGDPEAQKRFAAEVDSACVHVNASTRFSDGFEYGLGAEIGISTDKLHARGPMGLEELTTYKWVVQGNGQVRN
jgi:glutamate-5-semialdehyde dehydrogenase